MGPADQQTLSPPQRRWRAAIGVVFGLPRELAVGIKLAVVCRAYLSLQAPCGLRLLYSFRYWSDGDWALVGVENSSLGRSSSQIRPLSDLAKPQASIPPGPSPSLVGHRHHPLLTIQQAVVDGIPTCNGLLTDTFASDGPAVVRLGPYQASSAEAFVACCGHAGEWLRGWQSHCSHRWRERCLTLHQRRDKTRVVAPEEDGRHDVHNRMDQHQIYRDECPSKAEPYAGPVRDGDG
jgi:hypothetical protein